MSNGQRTPQGRSLNLWARQKVMDQLQKTGQALPCSVVSAAGAIITVNFEILSDYPLPQIEVPLFGPQYARYPMQEGEKGVVFAIDAQIGAMCGLGTGTADLAQPSNLGALVFMPIGNKDWFAVDGKYLVLYGADGGGVIVQDIAKKSSITVTEDGIACVGQNSFTAQVGNADVTLTTSSAVLAFGSNTITVNSSGIAIEGQLTINGVQYALHQHSDVTNGPDDTGPLA